MSAPSAPMGSGSACPLCASTLAPGATRCGVCGLHLATRPFTRLQIWAVLGALVAVYLVALAIVALTR